MSNSLGLCEQSLIRLPDCSLNLMQKVQNMAAKVVLSLRKHDSSTETLKTLHWLPIKQQIEYKNHQLNSTMYPWTCTKLSQEASRNTQTTWNRTKIIISSTQMGSNSQIHQEKSICRQVICQCCTKIVEPATPTIKRNHIK